MLAMRLVVRMVVYLVEQMAVLLVVMMAVHLVELKVSWKEQKWAVRMVVQMVDV